MSSGGYDVTPEPTPEEAAAVIAAIEQFLAETTIVGAKDSARPASGWLRASLYEGVGLTDPDAIW